MFTHTDIENFLQKGIQMLRDINVPVSSNICPRIDFPKAHSFYGYCVTGRSLYLWMNKYPKGYDFYIRISEFTLGSSEKSIMNTILHELLHTCPNCMDHQKQWRHWAGVVSKAYGYDIRRCAGDKSAADRANLRSPETSLHKIECTRCGNVWYRSRNSRLTLHPENYRCKCGGKLTCLY